MSYAWIIDRDHLDSDVSDVGVYGPRGIKDALHTALKSGAGKPFRMYDDDGELYYEGRLITSEDEQDPHEFSPLEDFGTPNAGATEIHYRDESGNWQRL